MVVQAYEELLPKGFHPGYFIFLEVEPSFIDINIHPTKTEIKFEDERSIGMLMRSAIKQSIGMFNVAPTIDFNPEMSFATSPLPKGKILSEPTISVNKNFNPFESGNNFEEKPSSKQIQSLQSMYEGLSDITPSNPNPTETQSSFENDISEPTDYSNKKAFQVKNKFIFTTIKSGVIIINQTRAHQRILYDQFIQQIENGKGISQQLLFPENVNFSASQTELLKELLPNLSLLGFDIEVFGANSFIVRGLPSVSANEDPKSLIEGTLFGYESNIENANTLRNEALASALAFKTAIKTGQQLSQEEINALIDELFASANPMTLPNGKIIFHKLPIDDIENYFN